MKEILNMLQHFVEEFDLPTDLPSCYAKCLEEDYELSKATTHDENVKEGADRVITGIRFLQSLHVDPEQAIKDKIEESHAKYAARRENERLF